ncbi:hypothetical protein [Mucilaginibacter gotjawali]|uniref:Uncharacterized protein n=2 Tax=Mucilaginibacter gotjawali TaxID=1550579 RepID=A0A110B1M2_9SPHI|nr:hypothetical protein [Mucilaginibacter gotjawali]MBB3057206.1 hypothetical protein [Mucilaginibacter gotjawali]BAU53027.1 hypothetical protein MgSA37_01194 [Mucilaginibacter gotjawali]
MKTLFIFLLIIQSKIAIDSSISICRIENKIKLDYLDSYNGISKIKSRVKADTLFLTISVSGSVENKTIEVTIPKGVSFVKYGKVLKEIDKLSVCPKVLSGKEAIESLKQ